MKEKELRKPAICSICKNKIGHTKLPLFWTVQVKRYGIKAGALQRQAGLTMMLGGNALLAGAMGPNEDMAECINTVNITVCEDCAINQNLPVAALAEMGPEDSEE